VHERAPLCTWYVLLAVLMSAVTLALWRGTAQPGEEPLAHIRVQGNVSPDGDPVGDPAIVTLTVDDAGQLLLAGVLNGKAIHRTGTRTQVMQQTFTAPATLIDAGWTTDVLFLEIEPITLISPGMPMRLSQIPLDIDDLPCIDDVLVPLLNERS
jgi:hypothetical protein